LKSKLLIALFLLSTIAVSVIAFPITNAHTPAWTNIPTHCFVDSAKTVGSGQQMLIIWWLDWIPPTSFGRYGDRWKVNVNVVKPDGTNETFGSLTSDPVGGGYITFTPVEVGNYTIQAFFPGQTLTGTNTPTGALSQNAYVNDTFAASNSPPSYFSVVEEQIPSYVETPLPTDYWTRPVSEVNRGWGAYAMGQWLGGPAFEGTATGYRLHGGIPNQEGPASSHVLWTRSVWSGGIMGGNSNDTGYYTGIAYQQYNGPNIVLEGKAYYSVSQPPNQGWYCIDLYTGQTLFFRNNTDGTDPIPAFGQIFNYASPNQYGGFPYLWQTTGQTVPAGSTSTTTWQMLDAYSAKPICKVANVSATGTQFIDSRGSICYLSFVNKGTTANPSYYMQIWNTTHAIWWRPEYGVEAPATLPDGSTSIPTVTSNTFWFWRPGSTTPTQGGVGYGAIYDGRNGYSMNVSIANILGPRNSVVNQTGTIRQIIPEKMVIVGTDGRNDARGTVEGFLRAYSLEAPTWGQTLWSTTFTPPKALDAFPNSTYLGEASCPVICDVSEANGLFLFQSKGTGWVWAYSLATGQQIWSAEQTDQFAYYGSSGSSLNNVIYQGQVFSIWRGSSLKVYNATTGQVQWTYTQPSVGYLETPYPASTQQLVFFVGDYIYLQPYEGAGLSNPIRRDGKIICLNTITGEELWGLTAWPGYNPGTAMPVVSDGRILYLDVHTNQIYCIGKGPSATTVNAPYSVPALGSSVTITGSVTDNSPSGRLNVNEGLDFTLKGTPAISDDYMNGWMEYMFQNRPIPANAKGVEVTLETIDPNNNLVPIGTTTTDIHGNYGLAFTPEVPGIYQIIAKFAGSNSYGPSSASTYLTVGEESPTPVPTYEPLNLANIESTIMLYVAVAAVAIIIAIAIVGFLILRKRP
jgi:hypothetical protein